MPETLATVVAEEPGETETYYLRLLHEFNNPAPRIEDAQRIWKEIRKHDVLFSDETKGDAKAFALIYIDPRSVWVEMTRVKDQEPVGLLYLTNVIVDFDADAHFTFWDARNVVGRDRLVLEGMHWAFARYKLKRLTASVPLYQRGTIRMIERVGFKEEGIKRAAVLRHGEPAGLKMYGILREEFEEIYVRDVEGFNGERNPARDPRGS